MGAPTPRRMSSTAASLSILIRFQEMPVNKGRKLPAPLCRARHPHRGFEMQVFASFPKKDGLRAWAGCMELPGRSHTSSSVGTFPAQVQLPSCASRFDTPSPISVAMSLIPTAVLPLVPLRACSQGQAPFSPVSMVQPPPFTPNRTEASCLHRDQTELALPAHRCSLACVGCSAVHLVLVAHRRDVWAKER
jgi:hypothetical protein